MKKHKRIKTAKRKQHNATAKTRHQEWLERCRIRDLEWEQIKLTDRLKRELTQETVEPALPIDPLARMLDNYLDGSAVPATSDLLLTLQATLPHLWRPNGSLDLYSVASRSVSMMEKENDDSKEETQAEQKEEGQ